MRLLCVLMLHLFLIGGHFTAAHRGANGYQGIEVVTTGSEVIEASSSEIDDITESGEVKAHVGSQNKAARNDVTSHNKTSRNDDDVTGTKVSETSDRKISHKDDDTREGNNLLTSDRSSVTSENNTSKSDDDYTRGNRAHSPMTSRDVSSDCKDKGTPHVITSGNATYMDDDLNIDIMELPPASHHRIVKRDNDYPPMEVVKGDYEWTDPLMSTNNHVCSTKKLIQIIPGGCIMT